MSLERAGLRASGLIAAVCAVPRAFKAFRSLPKDLKELLQGSRTAIPLADVRSTLEEHADHLGLNLRNTKYIAPKVSDMTAHMRSSSYSGHQEDALRYCAVLQRRIPRVLDMLQPHCCGSVGIGVRTSCCQHQGTAFNPVTLNCVIDIRRLEWLCPYCAADVIRMWRSLMRPHWGSGLKVKGVDLYGAFLSNP